MKTINIVDNIAIAAICIAFCAAPIIAKADLKESVFRMLDESNIECQYITDVDWYEEDDKSEVYFIACENNGNMEEIRIMVR